MLPDANSEWVRKHFTWPQRRSLILCPNIEVFEGSRGSGKTEKVLAPRAMHNAFTMRRSLGGLITPSYKKLFTELVPAIFKGWDDLGYIEGVHYTVKKPGPRSWGMPYRRPRDWSNCFHIASGSALAAVSQDRPELGVGMSFDFLLGEEARLLDGDAVLNRLRQTMRGNRKYFKDFAEHHSMLFVTDKGLTPRSRWYHVFKKSHDPEQVKMMLQLAYRRQQLLHRIRTTQLAPRTVQDHLDEIRGIENDMREERKNMTLFHGSSAEDVIEIIGWDNFMRMERDMDPTKFAITMMNEDVTMVEGSWYNHFDEQKHTYSPGYTSYMSERGLDRERLTNIDSRCDSEIDPRTELDIGMDFGGRFNCMAVGQMFHDLLRIDRGFHAFWPDTTEDVVKKFCKHYAHHKNKTVNFWWDHTAKDRHGASRYAYYEIVEKTLRDNGWVVNSNYIGHTASPPLRHQLFVQILKADLPGVQWNRESCSDMLLAMQLTRIREGKNGIEKDKRSESNATTEEQVHEPHYGDAVDTLVWGRFESMDSQAPVVIGGLFT